MIISHLLPYFHIFLETLKFVEKILIFMKVIKVSLARAVIPNKDAVK